MRSLGNLFAFAVTGLLLMACRGQIGDVGGSGRENGPDGGSALPGADAGFSACGDTGRALIYLEERCGNATCHGAGGEFPLLTRDGIAALSTLESEVMPGQPIIVPGDPEASWLYRKMIGDQGLGGGALMPLGISRPTASAEIIRAWISEGANAACDELPPTRIPYDPNTLDQETLFQCADPSADRSSPSRLRRINREEFTHAAARSLGGTHWGSTVKDNPLDVHAGMLYSTYTDGLSVDSATLNLYMLYLDEAAITWSAADPISLSPPGVRLDGVYGNRDLWCISSEPAPDAACIAGYVDTLLRRGTLFRAPTEGESARLHALVDETIAAEGGDLSLRQSSLHHIAQAAFLMKGALFRDEVGQMVDGALRLSDSELASSLGHVLSTFPVGAPLPVGTLDASDPDSGGVHGRLGAIHAAALDHTIQDAAIRRELIRQYAGGVAQARPDLAFDVDGRRIARRGQYWLAPTFANFFREWLDYSGADTSFKDTPGATGRWDGQYTGDSTYDPSTLGYHNLQPPIVYGFESSLVQQLDDTIARIVIESDASGQDVFNALMTARLWRVPSNMANIGTTPCTSNTECGGDFGKCTAIGLCGTSISASTAPMLRPYDLVDNVADAPDARWVQMPAERLGVLTHPAWLSAHGGNFEDDASLVHRGKWIRQSLFCQTVPPLELVMVEAQLVETHPDRSARQRVHESIETGPGSETCMGCHRLMNPLGVTFETFNHAGFVRYDDHGAPPDGSTTINNLPDATLNGTYGNPIEFIGALADSRYARRGFIRHAFRYFMGRNEQLSDACTLAEMEAALDNEGSFFAMVEALVSTETFTHRRIEEGAAR